MNITIAATRQFDFDNFKYNNSDDMPVFHSIPRVCMSRKNWITLQVSAVRDCTAT